MSEVFTVPQLQEALDQARAEGNVTLESHIAGRITAALGGADQGKSQMPNMDAYLNRCIARCQPKGAN